MENRGEFISVEAGPLLVGCSEFFNQLLRLIEKVKEVDVPVFIYGESGTGKELVARAIHELGPRGKGKFVALNCSAIPESLLESELFGHARGAFTGAVRSKLGLIEEADGGTFFLDEIGDLSSHLQAKLLRILEGKEVRRLGENRARPVNTRYISATNKNIEREIEQGNFREDLYYRLKIITIELPPLRERREDIAFLLDYFLQKYCREMGRRGCVFMPQTLELLLSHTWPGNVRELQNELQRCLLLCGEDNVIRPENLSSKISLRKAAPYLSSLNYFSAKAEFERRFVSQALARFNYHRSRTAQEMGLTRQGLFKLMKKHNIETPGRDKGPGI